jgi:hypothetical protein
MNDVSQDELQIRRLLEQYMRHNDDRALDRLLSLFTPDAIYRVGGGEHIGHEGMRRFLGGVGFKDDQRAIPLSRSTATPRRQSSSSS